MFDQLSSSQSLGIEADSECLRGAQVQSSRGGKKIVRLFQLFKNKEVGDGCPLSELSQSVHISSALPSTDVLVRNLELKLTKKKDIEAVLAFQAEPLLPYPIENAVLEHMIAAKTATQTQLALFAVRKDHLQEHLDLLADYSIVPETVSSVPVALAAYAYHFQAQKGSVVAVLYVGEIVISSVLCRDGVILAAQTLPHECIGINEEGLDNLALKMAQQLFSLAKQNRSLPINQMLTAGACASFPQLKEKLAIILNAKVSDIPGQDGYSGAEIEQYALPIGLALSALADYPLPQNFRKGEFAYPDPWKRFKLPLIGYLIAILSVSLGLYLAGEALAEHRLEAIKASYLSLLSSMDKSYANSELEFRSARKLPAIAATIHDLNLDEVKQRMFYLHEQSDKLPESYPLLPNTPRVSDVLAWLSQHPQVVQPAERGKPGYPLISLESFSYSMVKRPDQTKKQEKYQIKVELEFTAATPKLAREFHDALLAPNEFVNPKEEIKWNSSRDKYRTSFFLKDRTVYPSQMVSS